MQATKEWEFDLWGFRVGDIDPTRHPQARVDRVVQEWVYQSLAPPLALDEQVIVGDVEVVTAIFIGNERRDVEETGEGSLGDHRGGNNNHSAYDGGE
jgi:hypothetical protein